MPLNPFFFSPLHLLLSLVFNPLVFSLQELVLALELLLELIVSLPDLFDFRLVVARPLLLSLHFALELSSELLLSTLEVVDSFLHERVLVSLVLQLHLQMQVLGL